MPYGVYVAGTAGDEVSSTYEGRHLTFSESQITHPDHSGDEAADLVDKGDPVLVGNDIVGVALKSGVSVNTELIAIDTEGIFQLSVVATDEDGAVAVAVGDVIYIAKSGCLLSKNANKNTHQRFGYALYPIASGTDVIPVKVHWNPDDALEVVGQSGAGNLFVSEVASPRFREYHYEAQGGTYPHGDHLELTVTTTSCLSAQALVRKLLWTNDENRITGYAAVGEFELVVTGGAGEMDTVCVLHLTSSIGTLSATHVGNFAASWIYIQEYATVKGEQLNNLFSIVDADAGDYPYTSDSAALFSTSGSMTCNHSLRILVNGVPYWIMVAGTWA